MNKNNSTKKVKDKEYYKNNFLMLKALEEVDEEKAVKAISDPNLDDVELSHLLESGLMGKYSLKDGTVLKLSSKVLAAGFLNKMKRLKNSLNEK